jgi:hypothetical protein
MAKNPIRSDPSIADDRKGVRLARCSVVQAARRLTVLGSERSLASGTTDRGDAIPPGKASPHFHPPLLKDLL